MFPFMFLSLLFWIAVLGGGFYLAFRFVRAFERRGADRAELDMLRDRVARLEDSLDSTTNQLQELTEAQQFTQRLLTDRTDTTPPG